MDVHLLGPLEVLVDGRPVPLGATKQRALLAMLALQAGQTVTSDRLAEGLWGEDAPPSAHKMVQHYVSQLRRLLDGDDGEIVTRGRGYELRLGGGASDVARFEALLDGARLQPREALRLWRGPALADVAEEPFAAAEIRRLEELRLRALELAIDEDLAAGRHREVLTEVDALVAEHPLSERLHGQRIVALYRSGRQAEALEAYRRARRVLVDEVGIEPGPELRALHEAVLRQDPALDLAPPATRAPLPPPREPRRPSRRARPLVVAAAVTLAAGLAVSAIVSWEDEGGLPRIGENGVGRLDADGTIEARYALGGTPGAVVAGEGSIWVASARDRTVTRVDPERDRVATITVGAEPVGLAYGAGSVWVADGATRRLLRIDARTDRVVQELEVENVPRAIAAGEGAVWVASAVDGGITRIDLDRGRIGKPLRVGGSPTALAVGAGSVWAAGEADGTVTRIDARSGAPLRTIAVGGAPSAIAAAGDAVWVANRDDGTVSRIDAASGAVTETVRVGRGPVAVAADRDAVWVANAQDGTVSRIDPGTRRVTRTVDVGGGPAGLAVADGALWAAAGGEPARHRGGTLRVASDPIRSLDPAAPASYEPESYRAMGLVYDGLVAYRRAGGVAGSELVPNLAETVPRPTDDGRTYTFRLRPGLRYADGRPVRAADFRASVERVLRQNEGIPAYFAAIRGASACRPEAARCDRLSEGIRIDDRARTIVIRLIRPDGELLHKLALPFASVLPGGGARRGREVPPGTGPYRVAALDGDGEARLVRNPRFRSWSAEARPPGFPDEIRFADVDEADVDLRRAAPQRASELHELATRFGGRLRAEPTLATQYAFFDTRTPPFDDVRARRAVNYAVDRGRVLALVGGDQAGAITCRMLPPGLPGHRPACPFTRDATPAGAWTGPDLERARRLVRASGARGARVRLIAPAEFTSTATYLRDVLREIGLRPALRVFDDIGAYFELVNSGRFRGGLGLTVWFADVFAPTSFVEPLLTCRAGSTNYSRFCDRGFDALVRRAAQAREPNIADARWDAVERRLATLAPVVPLVHNRIVTILGERTDNFQNHPLWGPLLDQLWVR